MQYKRTNTSRNDQRGSSKRQPRDTTSCHNGGCAWICQVCGKTIDRGTGYIEIVNLDPSVGPVGEEPFEPTNVGFKVVHGRCDPMPDSDGYVIEVERISTDRDFIRWLHHLSGKYWMRNDDLREMIELWPIYSERGTAARRQKPGSEPEMAGPQGEGSNKNG